jgi:hypothetical protein
MKKSIIFTFYRVWGKKKSHPYNYRAISVSSMISKLFEKLILELLEKDGKVNLNASHWVFKNM